MLCVLSVFTRAAVRATWPRACGRDTGLWEGLSAEGSGPWQVWQLAGQGLVPVGRLG